LTKDAAHNAIVKGGVMGVVLVGVCFLAAWLTAVAVVCAFVVGAARGAAATAGPRAAHRGIEAAGPPQSWPQKHQEPARAL